MRTFLKFASAAAIAVASGVGPALAEFPEKPIKIVVSALPGGSPDILARIIGQHLSVKLGQSVIVENKSGGAGAIANEYVARSPADGYTLLGTSDTLGINKAFFPDQPDPLTSFTPVAQAMQSPQVLAVRADLPIETLAALLAAAKAAPEDVSIATPGVTTSGNLGSLMLENQAGVDFTVATYASASPALDDVIGGHVDAIFVTLGPALPHIQAGTLRAIAVTTPERTPSLPEVPTFGEQGFDGMTFTSWQGYVAPAGTPPDVVAKLNTAINEILADPKAREQLLNSAFEPAGGSPEHLGTLISDGATFWAKVVADNNVTLDK